MRWNIALHDLEVALDLDTDADRKLSWGEGKAGWLQIEPHAMVRLTIEGCELRTTLQFNVGLEMGQLMIVGVAAVVLFSVRDW